MSRRAIFENLKETTGFNILNIISNIYNYLDFVTFNYNKLSDNFEEIQDWVNRLKNSDKPGTELYQLHLEFSCYLLNYSATAKALSEKCMGWRNKLKKSPFCCDLTILYDHKLKSLNLEQQSGFFFNPLRNDFLHKADNEATIQYYLAFRFKRNEGASVQIFSKILNSELIPTVKKYYNSQTNFVKWFIQEIRKNFSKEIQQTQDTINKDSLNVIIHPSALR